MVMLFKKWIQTNEGLTHGQPPLERPDLNLRKDAQDGRPQAFPTYDLPGNKMKKHLKKRMKKN